MGILGHQVRMKPFLLSLFIALCVQFFLCTLSNADMLLLSPGWNFISFPKQPPNIAIDAVLGSARSNVRAVWGYDNQTKAWKRYLSGQATNTLSTMEVGKGYWVFASETDAIDMTKWTAPSATITLYGGWNLIGYAGADDQGITEALANVPGRWSIIWTWANGQWYRNHSANALPGASFTNIDSGKAYWIKMAEGQPMSWTLQGDVGNYFPTAVGNKWEYQVSTSATGEQEVKYSNTVEVTGKKMINDVEVKAFNESNYSNTGTSLETYLLKNSSGIIYYGSCGSSNTFASQFTPYSQIAFPFQEGSSFTQINKTGLDWGSDLDGDGTHETASVDSVVTFKGYETLALSWGAFVNCAKIETALTIVVTSSRYGVAVIETATDTSWYAPGVGLIKEIETIAIQNNTRTIVRELTAYTVDGRNSATMPPSIWSMEPTSMVLGNVTSVTVAFAEDMSGSTINNSTFTLKDSSNNSYPGWVTYDNKTATFHTSLPLPTGSYTASISTGAHDLDGNPLADTYTWSFKVDREGPTVVSTAPAGNATGVGVKPRIIVTFSEDMAPSCLNAITLQDDSGLSVGWYSTCSNNMAELVLSALLQRGKKYTATISPSITDAAGNTLGKPYSWTFTTDPGLFLPVVSLAGGSFPEAVAMGDLNGDGRKDLVVASSYVFSSDNTNQLLVYMQNSSGQLEPQAPIKYPPNGNNSPRSVAIGDLNHDGRNDIIAGNAPYNVEVFLQDSSGGFAQTTYATSDAASIRIADLNNDGLQDIVGAGWGTNTISIWYQNAGGGLNPPAVHALPHNSSADLAIGDVNNDGLTDIVSLNGDGSTDVALGVLTQRLDGTFNEPVYYSLQTSPWSRTAVAIGDLSGDGLNDIVVAYGGNSPTSKIAVFTQNVLGGFNPAVTYDSYDCPASVQIADFNSDGARDLIVRHNGWSTVGIYYGRPDRSLSAEDLYRVFSDGFNPGGMAVGDINGDGLNDVAIATSQGMLEVLYHILPQ